jgi:hypothetical protein
VNDPWIQKNLEKGYISSYNPTTDLGLFGCRHLPRYVSKAVAEYLRPDLKKVDPEANKKPKPAPEPPKKPEPAPEPKPKPAEGDSVTLTIEKTKTKPAGQSIKAQFTDIQKPLRETVQKALDLVAQVHGDGELKDIPFKLTKGRRFYGRITFLPSARGGYEANKIEINDSSVNEERSELTTIHELGHFLDMYSAGNKQNFGTRNGGGSKDLDQFLKVAGESKKIKALRALLLKGTLVDKDGKWFKMGADVRKFIRYTLKPEEIWARAYPQYIAYKTGDERLLRALQQKEGWMKQNGLQTQWDKEDFEEIGKEIEAFMIKKGWLSQ